MLSYTSSPILRAALLVAAAVATVACTEARDTPPVTTLIDTGADTVRTDGPRSDTPAPVTTDAPMEALSPGPDAGDTRGTSDDTRGAPEVDMRAADDMRAPADMRVPEIDTRDAPITCSSGTHLCGSTCASNTSVATCGTSCMPCPVPTGGTATCDGTNCGATCPAGKKLCAGACIDEGRSCNGACPAGTHDCAGVCASNMDVRSCGTSCTPCAAPAGGLATCDGTKCGFTCAPGRRVCGSACIGDAEPCNGACPPAMHVCSSTCVSNSNVATCGSSCTPCPAPANAVATCDGTKCDFRCTGGYFKCGGVCYNDIPGDCDNTCPAGCPTPENATATCHKGVCGLVCSPGTLTCGSGAGRTCLAQRWSFEGRTLGGWVLEDGNSFGADGPLTTSTMRALDGTVAMAVAMRVASGRTNLSFMHRTCNAGLDLRGKMMSARIYLDGPERASNPSDALRFYVNDTVGGRFVGANVAPTMNKWIEVRAPFTDQPVFDFSLYLYIDSTSPWTGTVYVDDIRIE